MKKYQIFISSTYNDLQKERQAVLESVLRLRHIPVGMEHFVATNEEQFRYIKKLLEDTDYYIVIVGNRYGSIAEDGISYTEKEFDYAVSLGIPIIACVYKNPEDLSVSKSETDKVAIAKLNKFRKKIMHNRMVSYINWTSPESLSSEIVVALVNVMNDTPRKGWERVGVYDNDNLLSQINELRIENEELKAKLKGYEESVQTENGIDSFPWEDTLSILAPSGHSDYMNKNVSIKIELSWRQIFSILGRILLFKNDPTLVHFDLNHTLFLDRIPYYYVLETDFQLIVSEFAILNLINIEENRICLSSDGKKYLFRLPPVSKNDLAEIHQRVLSFIIEMPST